MGPAATRTPGFIAGAWLAGCGTEEALELVLLESHPPAAGGGEDAERWDVLALAGRLGGEWCVVQRLAGDALRSVMQAAVDWAAASSGTVGAVGLVDPDCTVGFVYTFSDQRFPEGHGGTLYRVLATA